MFSKYLFKYVHIRDTFVDASNSFFYIGFIVKLCETAYKITIVKYRGQLLVLPLPNICTFSQIMIRLLLNKLMHLLKGF